MFRINKNKKEHELNHFYPDKMQTEVCYSENYKNFLKLNYYAGMRVEVSGALAPDYVI
ncbi:MAG: hypothetical protein ABIL70_07270 [candidate division WOR-3 bacterium]